MKYLLMIVLLLVADQAWADFLSCPRGTIYTGDSQAEVGMKCGPPIQAFSAPPVAITEQHGDQTITRWLIRTLWIYPAGSSQVYYLKFENNKLLSIDMGTYGEIPK